MDLDVALRIAASRILLYKGHRHILIHHVKGDKIMASKTGQPLRRAVQDKMRELEEAVAGVSEDGATRRPGVGEWCVKEVLSHLLGEEGKGYVAILRRFVEEDTPLIQFDAGLSYYTPKRQGMSAATLVAELRKEYEAMAGFLESLREEQLARKAHVPLFKGSPLGEYPTLGQLANGLINFHLVEHINRIRKLL